MNGTVGLKISDTAHLLSQLDLRSRILRQSRWGPQQAYLGFVAQKRHFRWLRQRTTSPWYPSMCLFRQYAHGDWKSVVDQLSEAFDSMLCLPPKLWLRGLLGPNHARLI